MSHTIIVVVMVLAMRATGAKGLGLPPRTAGLGSRRSSRASRETRLRARAAVRDLLDQLEVVGTLRELPRSAEALVASAVDAVPLPSEGLEQGWGLELLREVILQAAFKVASYAPEGSLPDWDVVERTLAAIASANVGSHACNLIARTACIASVTTSIL